MGFSVPYLPLSFCGSILSRAESIFVYCVHIRCYNFLLFGFVKTNTTRFCVFDGCDEFRWEAVVQKQSW